MRTREAIHNFGALLVTGFILIITSLFFLPDRFVGAQVFDGDFADESAQELSSDIVPALDTDAYDLKMRQLAHLKEDEEAGLWPTDAVYPEVDALLPFNRIVAYYGNFYSKGMGILGQYSSDEVMRRLNVEVEAWKKADPTTPVVPAIDYIAVTAQLSAGRDGKHRARMPEKEIKKAIAMAEQVDGIVILEVQPGLSDVMTEVKMLEPYLSLPQVHLAIDPEFAMKKSGSRPGTRVGTVDAAEVNAVADYLATLVRTNDLPPKVLVVHRYTQAMVTNATNIKPLPEVEILMDMDGWGSPGAKRATYQAYIYSSPVQFTGFKLFYRNDVRYAGSRMMTPAEILDLTPQPSFIQYQ